MCYAALLGLIAGLSCLLRAQPGVTGWQPLSSNSMVTLGAERALYETSDSADMFIRFRLTNRTTRSIAYTLDDIKSEPEEGGCVHPSTWQVSEGPRWSWMGNHFLILGYIETNSQRQARLKSSFLRGQTLSIPPHQSRDYFAACPAGGWSEMRKGMDTWPFWMHAKHLLPQRRHRLHLIVRLRGSMVVTDGKAMDEIFVRSDMALPRPLVWKSVPQGAQLVRVESA